MTSKIKTPDPETERMKAAHAARMATIDVPTQPREHLNGHSTAVTAAQIAEAINDPQPTAPPELAARVEELEAAEALAIIGGKMSLENVRGLITQECRAIETMLLDKNRKYGNSALEPRRVFSKASPVEQIKVRIDDKISRLDTVGMTADEDTVADLIGYLVLMRVAHRLGLR